MYSIGFLFIKSGTILNINSSCISRQQTQIITAKTHTLQYTDTNITWTYATNY